MIKKAKLIQIKSSQLPAVRKKQWLKQGKRCAISGKKIKFEDSVMDHKHKLKKQKAGPKGRGLLRGVLHNQVNSLEGIIMHKYKRQGVHNIVSLYDFLIGMAKYIKNPPMPQRYIHPKEAPPKEILGKRDYNKIKKYYFIMFPQRRKPLTPLGVNKKGKSITKLSQKWKDLLEQANLKHKCRKRKK